MSGIPPAKLARIIPRKKAGYFRSAWSIGRQEFFAECLSASDDRTREERAFRRAIIASRNGINKNECRRWDEWHCGHNSNYFGRGVMAVSHGPQQKAAFDTSPADVSIVSINNSRSDRRDTEPLMKSLAISVLIAWEMSEEGFPINDNFMWTPSVERALRKKKEVNLRRTACGVPSGIQMRWRETPPTPRRHPRHDSPPPDFSFSPAGIYVSIR